MAFMGLPAVAGYVNASNPARNSQLSSDGAHHVLCPILGYQPNLKHGSPDGVDVEWIKTNMTQTTLDR